MFILSYAEKGGDKFGGWVGGWVGGGGGKYLGLRGGIQRFALQWPSNTISQALANCLQACRTEISARSFKIGFLKLIKI
jgi:hypothetical protein